jgi:hypothetical protein
VDRAMKRAVFKMHLFPEYRPAKVRLLAKSHVRKGEFSQKDPIFEKGIFRKNRFING